MECPQAFLGVLEMIDLKITIQGLQKLQEAAEAFSLLAQQLSGDFQREAADAISEHIAERAVQNAPILRNRLRPAIHATTPQKRGSGYRADVQIPDYIPYASLMHMHLVPYGTPIGISAVTQRPIFSLGPVSRTMPATPEGGVGGMFITRVAQFHMSQYETQMAQVLSTILQRRRVRTYKFSP